MKKRETIGIFIFLSLILFLGTASSLSAEENLEVLNKAKTCLSQTIENKTCTSLTLEERIFAYLGVGKCKEEIISSSQSSGECWPTGNCNLKTTALATLALAHSGENTNKSQQWMLGKKIIAKNVEWYLQIDTSNASVCKITYKGSTHTATISEDKKVTINSQMCLNPSSNGYWFRINPSCYEEEFEISCDKNFMTSLIFKKQNNPTIHVLKNLHSSAMGGVTNEKVQSYCFSTNSLGVCDYEGSLWAASVLNYLGHDVSEYIPYLIANVDDFPQFFPQSFLYLLTGKLEYRTDILNKQINKQYWRVSGDRFYDTSLALLPFQGTELEEKTFSKDWLKSVQASDGCWDNKNIINNGFLIYSIWGEFNKPSSGLIPGSSIDCEEIGYHCVSLSGCEGELLPQYSCFGISKICCSSPEVILTCDDQEGVVCKSGEYCKDGSSVNTPELSYGQKCCIGGTCAPVQDSSEFTCESNGGLCESYSCAGGYAQTSVYTCDFGDICCVQKPSSGSYWWIWVLLILIIIVALIIYYKEKVKEIIWKMKGGKSPKSSIPPKSPPPVYPRQPQMNLPQRKVIPPQPRMMPQRRVVPVKRSSKELDDVLEKLKNMSKE